MSFNKIADVIYKVTGVEPRPENHPRSIMDLFSEFDSWRERNSHKVGYKVAHGVTSTLHAIWKFPSNTRSYLHNRFVSKTHYLQTGMKAGYYFEIEDRMIHAMFNTLVEYVQGEKAWMQHIWANDGTKAQWRRMSKSERLIEGVKYLNWEISLTNEDGTISSQSVAAREQLDLLNWWTDVRPNRPDDWHDDWSENIRVSEQYDREDTEMLVRLIKIRQSLWT